MTVSRSAAQLMADAPKRYDAFHYRITKGECEAAMAEGRTFYSYESGEHLRDVDAVRDAMARDKVVESRS